MKKIKYKIGSFKDVINFTSQIFNDSISIHDAKIVKNDLNILNNQGIYHLLYPEYWSRVMFIDWDRSFQQDPTQQNVLYSAILYVDGPSDITAYGPRNANIIDIKPVLNLHNFENNSDSYLYVLGNLDRSKSFVTYFRKNMSSSNCDLCWAIVNTDSEEVLKSNCDAAIAEPKFSPYSLKIAFADLKKLFVMNPENKQVQELHDASSSQTPIKSLQFIKIAEKELVIYLKDNIIYIASCDGEIKEYPILIINNTLFKYKVRNMEVSPDQTFVAVTTDKCIFLQKLFGSNQSVIYRTIQNQNDSEGFSSEGFNCVTWSQDGMEIIFYEILKPDFPFGGEGGKRWKYPYYIQSVKSLFASNQVTAPVKLPETIQLPNNETIKIFPINYLK